MWISISKIRKFPTIKLFMKVFHYKFKRDLSEGLWGHYFTRLVTCSYILLLLQLTMMMICVIIIIIIIIITLAMEKKTLDLHDDVTVTCN